MDEQLAAIYGTGQPEVVEEDLQKMAAAEFLVKLAEEQGVDLSQFSDEDINGMISELYTEKTAAAGVAADEPDPEFLEKAAEADQLGRIVAHAMWQEMGNIQKSAGAPPAGAPAFPFPPKEKKEKKEEEKEEKKEEEKTAALEEIAQQRAFDMAKEAGYIDAEGNQIQQAPAQDQKEKLAAAMQQAVEHRALQICEEAGLPVEWNA